MDTISINALASLPEPTQSHASVMALAQNESTPSFGAMLATSSQSTTDTEATITVATPPMQAGQNVNKLTVPPNVIVEAVIAAINVAISLSALKSATDALATHSASSKNNDQAWVPVSVEKQDLDRELPGMYEAAESVTTKSQNASTLTASIEQNNEHASNVDVDEKVDTTEHEPACSDLTDRQYLAPLMSIEKDGAHTSPDLNQKKDMTTSGKNEILLDLAPNTVWEKHHANADTEETTTLFLIDNNPQLTPYRDTQTESEEVTIVDGQNAEIASALNNENTKKAPSSRDLAKQLSQKNDILDMSQEKPAGVTADNVLHDNRPLNLSNTSIIDNIYSPTDGQKISINHDDPTFQRASSTADPQAVSMSDAFPIQNTTDENANSGPSNPSGTATHQQQNGRATKTANPNLDAIADQAPRTEIIDQTHKLTDDDNRSEVNATSVSKNLDQTLSSRILQTHTSDIMIRASLERVVTATDSLIKVSQERLSVTPDSLASQKVEINNISSRLQTYETGKLFFQNEASPTNESLIASKSASRTNDPAAIAPGQIPDLNDKTDNTETISFARARDFIVSASAYIAPTNAEQADDIKMNEAQAKIVAASNEACITTEMADHLPSSSEMFARPKSYEGDRVQDVTTKPQIQVQTINTEAPETPRGDNDASAQVLNSTAPAQKSHESSDFRPRQISEEIRIRALERQVLTAAREGANQIRMQLYPPGMGQVLIRLALDGSKLRLQFRTSNGDAASSLYDVEDALRHALSDSGFTITSFDVSADDSEARDQRRRGRNNVSHAKKQQDASQFYLELQA